MRRGGEENEREEEENVVLRHFHKWVVGKSECEASWMAWLGFIYKIVDELIGTSRQHAMQDTIDPWTKQSHIFAGLKLNWT